MEEGKARRSRNPIFGTRASEWHKKSVTLNDLERRNWRLLHFSFGFGRFGANCTSKWFYRRGINKSLSYRRETALQDEL